MNSLRVLLGADYDAVAGDYEIMGDDSAQFLAGLAPVPQQQLLPAPQQQMLQPSPQLVQQIAARNASLLRETAPTKKRIFPLGFTSPTPIRAGDSAIIVTRPQVLFKGMRLLVPSDISGDFAIDDLKVGKNSQFVAEASIPARILQEDAWGVLMMLDTAQISQDISIAVTNIGGAERVFRAAIIGEVAEV